jgi:glutamate synthase domain-containing protein 3
MDRVTITALAENILEIDLDRVSVREANATVRALPAGSSARLTHPRGRHNLAVGLTADVDVHIDGPAGYYPGGLGAAARVHIHGPAGWGAGENLMSGAVYVHGDASQSAAASAHGGEVVVYGDASLRAGISLKGGTLVVAGSVGPFCGFMAQAGAILVAGDAGADLGDSLYEAVIYVGGRIQSLGTDAQIEDLTDADMAQIADLSALHGLNLDPAVVTKVASAKQLYHFDTHNSGSY